MERNKFRQLVSRAIRRLPPEFALRLENVAIVTEYRPSAHQLATAGMGRGQDLLGLYEGVPLTQRSGNYGLVAPDKITIFQRPIEVRCHTEAQVIEEVEKTIRHEIAHHFGIGDERLSELERA